MMLTSYDTKIWSYHWHFEKFCEVYEELYNSSGSSEALEEIKNHLQELIAESDGAEHEIFKITGSIVKEAAYKMKAGKGDVSEGYTSDAILNAPDSLSDHLALVY